MHTSLAAILLTSIIPCVAFAQNVQLASLERGARIRVSAATVPESEKIGRFRSLSADSIQFFPDSRPITRSVALQEVRTIEVSRQTRTRRSEFVMGGVLVGGIIGYVSSNHGGTGLGTGNTDASQNAIVGGIAGVVIGGALGWWLGGKKEVDNWQQVDR